MKIQIEEADLRSVLEALEMWSVMTLKYMDARDKAITICKQTLEQTAQQQEPVAWLWKNIDGHQVLTDDPDYADGTWTPLYTTPPAPAQQKPWVGLTDEERSYYLQSASNVGWWQASLFIETKLKEKNHG